MRVLHATAWYPPTQMGGTEIYLSNLINELVDIGIECRVIAPLEDALRDGHKVNGTVLRTYRVNDIPPTVELRGEVPHEGFTKFKHILAEERPDIYHQHSWSRGLGAKHLREARKAGLKTVLTVHTPNNICMRGTMMRFGEEACDGLIDPLQCGACWAQSRGAPKALAYALASIPDSMGSTLATFGSRMSTALLVRNFGQRRLQEFQQMIANADHIVAVCRWLYDALEKNGVPPAKLTLSRQGVESTVSGAEIFSSKHGRSAVFRLLFLGRWHPVKGIAVLVRAVRNLPEQLPIELVIHGLGAGPEEQVYKSEIHRLIDGDPRIVIAAPIERAHLAKTLSEADALAVPSLWLETGPLVVLEAMSVGLPIIGSRLGGIAELVNEPEDGMLVMPGNVKAWTDAIHHLMLTPASTRRGTKVRTMREVAREMAALYQQISRLAS